MSGVYQLKKKLIKGAVYRRKDLAKWSTAVDRHLHSLVEEGTLKKMSAGVYYYPKESVFGATPPEEEELVRSFLKDDRFLLTSPNAYNSLGVGTTQLYNTRTVYNHKRHGEFMLGNRKFNFKLKHHFPLKLTPEFLLVDLANNSSKLAEDREALEKNLLSKADSMDKVKLSKVLSNYGGVRAKNLLEPILQKTGTFSHGR